MTIQIYELLFKLEVNIRIYDFQNKFTLSWPIEGPLLI